MLVIGVVHAIEGSRLGRRVAGPPRRDHRIAELEDLPGLLV